MDYSKHKERRPEETVLEIERILNGIGLFPVLEWTEGGVQGARSCRVTLHPTEYGTNGKGTDEVYASASGYAELMERLENGILTYRDRGDDLSADAGFREFPDEKDISIQSIADDPDPYTGYLMDELGLGDKASKESFLRSISALYGRDDDMLTTVPFADLFGGRLQWIPPLLLHEFAMSNGMAAGNTMEEAMVQGLSELLERAVCKAVICGRAVPPVIPEEEMKDHSLRSLVEKVNVEGRFHITLIDGSMGKGWPVAGAVITDLKTGGFGIKFGAHPSFPVAIERCLTEALQGRSMESIANAGSIGSQEKAANYHNVLNVLKAANGYWPASVLSERPGWEYEPWPDREEMSNRELLKVMLGLLEKEGLRPLVRDTSFLGFPSCFIVVPELSNVYTDAGMRRRDIVTVHRARRSWDHFPDLDPEEEQRLLKLIRFNENSIRDNQVSFATARQLSDIYEPDRVAAFISLKHGEFGLAEHFFSKLGRRGKDRSEKQYYLAMERYSGSRKKGLDAAGAHKLIRSLFGEDTAERVLRDTSEPETLMERSFPEMNCYDCAHCGISGKECTYPLTRDIVVKVMHAMKKEKVSQEALFSYV